MSLNSKIIIICLLLFIVAPYGAYRYYRYLHPKYVPPPPRKEITITIIPGWNLRNIAEDWVKKGLIKTPQELYTYTGQPGVDFRTLEGGQVPVYISATSSEYTFLFEGKPEYVSYEGYLWPDTYRVYADATVPEILDKIFRTMRQRISPELEAEIRRQSKSFYDVLVMGSIIEKEVRGKEDRRLVSDILWSRINHGMRLQVDSSVHYFSGRQGDVFTTDEERATDSPWNTYKRAGLPLSPISNPGLEAIEAAVYPTKNDYLYFLTGKDGKNYFAKTLEEHNKNVWTYLR